MHDSQTFPVVIFGSDGGGSLLALDTHGQVWFLPTSAVHGGIYHEGQAKIVACGHVSEFFPRLIRDILQWISGDMNHPYIGRRTLDPT